MFIVYAFAVMLPFAVIGWFLERVLRKDDRDASEAEIAKADEHVAALECLNDGLVHSLQDEQNAHADAELALDEAEEDLAECATDLEECEIGLAGYVKAVDEQDVMIADLREELTLRDEMLNDLESTILDLRVSQAGQKRLEPVAAKTKKARKAS